MENINSFVSMATAKKWDEKKSEKVIKKRSREQIESMVLKCIEEGIDRPFFISKKTGIHSSHVCVVMRRIGCKNIQYTRSGTHPERVRVTYKDGRAETFKSQLDAAKSTGYCIGWISTLIKTGKHTKLGVKFERV